MLQTGTAWLGWLMVTFYVISLKPCPACSPTRREVKGDPRWEESQSGKGPPSVEGSHTTHPFSCDDEDGCADGARVHPIAPAVMVDPHGNSEDTKHHKSRPLGLVKVGQCCRGWGENPREVSGLCSPGGVP